MQMRRKARNSNIVASNSCPNFEDCKLILLKINEAEEKKFMPTSFMYNSKFRPKFTTKIVFVPGGRRKIKVRQTSQDSQTSFNPEFRATPK